ncbi:hypothetical protein CMO92_01285 [Candidatus Woesearchaeota archaeon]|nr:hypothetical protein [Candidatus Woesearchaeota archaeon]|tara:strand:- start:1054 stop:1365 length:312 start_codon:yes stop_codon:yes gene_type:complete
MDELVKRLEAVIKASRSAFEDLEADLEVEVENLIAEKCTNSKQIERVMDGLLNLIPMRCGTAPYRELLAYYMWVDRDAALVYEELLDEEIAILEDTNLDYLNG